MPRFLQSSSSLSRSVRLRCIMRCRRVWHEKSCMYWPHNKPTSRLNEDIITCRAAAAASGCNECALRVFSDKVTNVQEKITLPRRVHKKLTAHPQTLYVLYRPFGPRLIVAAANLKPFYDYEQNHYHYHQLSFCYRKFTSQGSLLQSVLVIVQLTGDN